MGFDGFQGFLEPHSGCGQETRRWIDHRQCTELCLKLLLIRHLSRARLTAGDVLLQLVPGVVGELVVQIQRDILLYPIAIHSCYLIPNLGLRHPERRRPVSTGEVEEPL
jgi:hypothetical protein